MKQHLDFYDLQIQPVYFRNDSLEPFKRLSHSAIREENRMASKQTSPSGRHFVARIPARSRNFLYFCALGPLIQRKPKPSSSRPFGLSCFCHMMGRFLNEKC